MDTFAQIFALVTGVIYIVLEIRQKNFMWVVGIFTSMTTMTVFWGDKLYASFLLNLYYLAMSFWGLDQWRKAAGALKGVEAVGGEKEGGEKGGDRIHLNRMTWKTVLGCCAFFVVALVLLRLVLNVLHDPMSGLDAAVAVLSAVATYMLSRSYIQQWLVWIVADTLSVILCATQGMYWMTALYVAYTASAIYGYYYWKKKGVYINE